MLNALKRTTAIAALAALPFSPVAAQSMSGTASGSHEQSQSTENKGQSHGAQSQSQAGSGQGGAQTGDLQKAPDAAEQQASENQQLIQQQTPTGAGQAGSQGTAAAGQSGGTGTDTQAGADSAASGEQNGAATGQGPQSGEATAGAAAQEDLLIATVGDAEIRRSDVIDAIGQLPPQLQQQAPEMLIPLAIDQLVTRELILQEARNTDLAQDPEVLALAPDNATETARENALVQVWLDRELKERVTDDKVQAAYDAIKAQFGAQAPELDQLRPQIEGQLRQQAFAEISGDLQTDAEITVYGPDGQPVEQQ